MKKYYVWNDKIQVLVMAESTMKAVAEALSYCGFKCQTEIPAHLISWDLFYVDERGFRNKPELFNETILTNGECHREMLQEGASYWIMKEAALNWFDHYMKEYDPFCENDE